MAVISRPLDLLELMRERCTQKWNATAQSRATGLDFVPPPKQCHAEGTLNKITSSELFLCAAATDKWKSRLLHMSEHFISVQRSLYPWDLQVSWRNPDYAHWLIITFLQKIVSLLKPPWQPSSTCGETAGSNTLALFGRNQSMIESGKWHINIIWLIIFTSLSSVLKSAKTNPIIIYMRGFSIL